MNLNLAIEIDGSSHNHKAEQDLIRQKRLESFGIHFLRFEDSRVKKDIHSIILAIECWIEEYEKNNQTK